ncbi:hypothetical protein TSH58p_25345 (plasmid) [Azospirillum sp. TSH58]|uniref:BREX system P-loop protein BrxC n=1 Tax=Azospirillum sp. TSH58 TaxID=664962 RepID=UPI000D5FFFFE|nr:BREX system P-loop protein BrxC [Azospirillum sp. TSH58]AWJ86777.1 hypothetical protein TSH58p_25345 [Azospirillum sp. TSH58]PWC62890.1 hypothetical protein TSH58_24525 [Azospirillum sp. TSH58]
MLIKELFTNDVTRDIPPVVYFHEQAPESLAAEVGEYIVTGGYPETDPRHRRVPDGIHEQFVRLLRNLCKELRRPGGPELPASWISGFYGSGKSSFAKLLGLALDGGALPDGRPLADALLARDTSPLREELVAAWEDLRSRIDPIAVVFDIGAVARDGEHIHAAVVRQVQERLGYCPRSVLVAETELKLEADGRWEAFLEAAAATLGGSWDDFKGKAMAEDHFSAAMHRLDPQTYTDPMSWADSHAGRTATRGLSVDEATRAIDAMLRRRATGKTLFLVVDEVSQYVHQDEDRMLKLQSFVSALGQRLKGSVWLLATGQQKLDDDAGATLAKLKDRFPPSLRVHLSAANIRDVVHRRLLEKRSDKAGELRSQFQRHRADLKLHAYGCADVTEEDFVEVYPLLPGHVDLLMRITTAMRVHSTRMQGDTHAIRGLLQMLGELFRTQNLAERPLGALVTLDAVYDIQYTSLDASLQQTLAQVHNLDLVASNPLAGRIVKAVALLEQIQDQLPTTAELVAQCLYAEIGQGSQVRPVQDMLQALKDANCLSYTEQYGYKLQSSAGQEWMKERDDPHIPDEVVHEVVREKLGVLMGRPDRPRWKGRPFPWALFFTDRFRPDVRLTSGREDTTFAVDFRFLTDQSQRRSDEWVRQSDQQHLRDRLVWLVGGDLSELRNTVRDLVRSRRMLETYEPRREALNRERLRLLIEEQTRRDGLEGQVDRAAARAFLDGRLYFRGRELKPSDFGNGFDSAIVKAAERFLPELYTYFTELSVGDREWPQLLERDLGGASRKFYEEGLGILALDAGKTVPACSGTIPMRILQHIEENNGASGSTIIQHFGRPPYGYPVDVVRACLIGLLRAGKIRIRPEGGGTHVTSCNDPGVKELFAGDRNLRQAEYYPGREGDITQRDLNAIGKFFDSALGVEVDRDRDAIADAAFKHFPNKRAELREVEARYERLPGRPELPPALTALTRALEDSVVDRHVEAIVKAVKANLDRLRDGLELLGIVRSELTDEAVEAVRALAEVRDVQLAQLRTAPDGMDDGTEAAGKALEAQLAQDRPWRERAGAEAAAGTVRDRYRKVRRAILARQETEAEAARERIKARDGFAKLSPDASHRVLRPIAEALFATSEDAVQPALFDMAAQFPDRLRRKAEDADARLDEELEKILAKPVKPVRLKVQGRELETRDQLKTFLREIEDELGPLVDQGVRVRVM